MMSWKWELIAGGLGKDRGRWAVQMNWMESGSELGGVKVMQGPSYGRESKTHPYFEV